MTGARPGGSQDLGSLRLSGRGDWVRALERDLGDTADDRCRVAASADSPLSGRRTSPSACQNPCRANGFHLPDPALVVLVGASGSGKSTWAQERYRADEIVSSDDLRAVVGSGRHDLDASADAFSLLEQIVAGRLRRGLATVVDTLGFDVGRRRGWLDRAHAAGLPASIVLFDTPAGGLAGSATPTASGRSRRASSPNDCAHHGVPRRRSTRRDANVVVTLAADEPPATGRGELTPPVAQEGTETATRRSSGLRALRRPAGVPLPVGRGPGRLAPRGGAGRRRLRFPGDLVDGPPDPDPTGRNRVGADPRALGVPRDDRRARHRLAPRDPRLSGHLPTPASWRRPPRPSTCCHADGPSSDSEPAGGARACCLRPTVPSTSARLDLLEQTIETVRALWASRTKPHDGPRVTLPETTSYPRPVSQIPIIVGGGGGTAYSPDRRRFAERLQRQVCQGLPGQEDRRAPPALRRRRARPRRGSRDGPRPARRRPRPRRRRARVERLRGRSAATTYAARHHAGTPRQHRVRYERLGREGCPHGVRRVPDLTGPDDVMAAAGSSALTA